MAECSQLDRKIKDLQELPQSQSLTEEEQKKFVGISISGARRQADYNAVDPAACEAAYRHLDMASYDVLHVPSRVKSLLETRKLLKIQD